MARTFGKSRNSEVLVARTCKTYENRVFLRPEHVEIVQIPILWWPGHGKTHEKRVFWWPEQIENLKILIFEFSRQKNSKILKNRPI